MQWSLTSRLGARQLPSSGLWIVSGQPVHLLEGHLRKPCVVLCFHEPANQQEDMSTHQHDLVPMVLYWASFHRTARP